MKKQNEEIEDSEVLADKCIDCDYYDLWEGLCLNPDSEYFR